MNQLLTHPVSKGEGDERERKRRGKKKSNPIFFYPCTPIIEQMDYGWLNHFYRFSIFHGISILANDILYYIEVLLIFFISFLHFSSSENKTSALPPTAFFCIVRNTSSIYTFCFYRLYRVGNKSKFLDTGCLCSICIARWSKNRTNVA